MPSTPERDDVVIGPPVESRIPNKPSLITLRESAATCTACALYAKATQTVFGVGTKKADLMLVGEQPGDAEDRAGEPFVGPSGKLLDDALQEAGIDRSKAYVTNVVKHFKWEPRGKRRVHSKPNVSEIRACRPWLDEEIAVVAPRALVCLGSTAAQALLGRAFRVTEQRGKAIASELAEIVVATVHPSSILRERDRQARETATARFIDDLRVVVAALR